MEITLLCWYVTIVVVICYGFNAEARSGSRRRGRDSRSGGIHKKSILWRCEDPDLLTSDCLFLRNNTDIWRDLRELKNQIRRLRDAEKVSVPELIPVEEMRLQILEVRIDLTRSTEKALVLDQELRKLKAEDERFRASLQYLKHVDNNKLWQEINQVKAHMQETRYYFLELVQNETQTLQEQIDSLKEENTVLRNNQQIIQDDSLVFIREELNTIKMEKDRMQKHLESVIRKQEDALNKKIEDCQSNVHTVNKKLHVFKGEQVMDNIDSENKYSLLANDTEILSEKIESLNASSETAFKQINLDLSDLSNGINMLNSSLKMSDDKNENEHVTIHHNIATIDQNLIELNTSITALKDDNDLQHHNIHNILNNITINHKNLEQNLMEYKEEQEVVINGTHQDILNVWDGKEFVNQTLVNIIHTQARDQNITQEIAATLHAANHQQDITFKAVTEAQQQENLDIRDLINNLDTVDVEIQISQHEFGILMQKERNFTIKALEKLRHIDSRLNRSIHSLTHKLSGPFLLFTAYPSHKYIKYETYDKLIFDRVILNFGDYYNVTLGSFTCPVHGIYQAFLSVWSEFDERAQIELMRDNEVLFKAAAQPDPGSRQHGSNQASFECERGQEVWIRGGTYGVLYTDDNKQNSFTANLMHNLEHFPPGVDSDGTSP